MNKTKIQWCDYTWNPIVGCSEISEGCKHCYAKAIARRFGRYAWGTPVLFTDRLQQCMGLRKPSKIFPCSMSDLFHESLRAGEICEVIDAMIEAVERIGHTFIVLTKRPKRMAKIVDMYRLELPAWKNIWLGITGENQRLCEDRWAVLHEIPVRVRFASIEPMLGPIDIGRLRGAGPDWYIVGPETGPGARQCKTEWISDLAADCAFARIPFFDKRPNPIRREFPQ